MCGRRVGVLKMHLVSIIRFNAPIIRPVHLILQRGNLNFMKAKDAYERLHEDLLYTDEKQIFDDAVNAFEKLNNLFCEMGE